MAQTSTHLSNELKILQGYVRGYKEISLLHMEHRFNIYSIISKYIQLFDDVFKYLKIFEIHLKISSNNWMYLQLFGDIFIYWINVKMAFHI